MDRRIPQGNNPPGVAVPENDTCHENETTRKTGTLPTAGLAVLVGDRYPNERGGSTRRSTGVPVAEDPQGLKAQAVRAAWRAQGNAEQTGEGATFDDLLLLYMQQVTPAKRAPERDN